MVFDPRTIATPVHDALQGLRSQTPESDPKQLKRLKQQKNQAVELYTYLSTWGLLRLKAEETAISDEQEGKRQVVKAFFTCLETLSTLNNLANSQGLETLNRLDSEEYLGLTGLALTLAQEFNFWAMAIYHDVKGEE